METQSAVPEIAKDHAMSTDLPVIAGREKKDHGKVPMVEMISLRTFLLSTKTGHMVRFEAGVSKMVPTAVVAEAMEKGCVPTDQVQVPYFESLSRAKAEFSGDLRRSLILATMEVLVEDNNAKNFEGNGMPRLDVLGERIGFDVSKAERQSLYQELMGARKAGADLSLHPDTETVRLIVSASNRKELMSILPRTNIPPEQAKGLQIADLRKLLLGAYALAQR